MEAAGPYAPNIQPNNLTVLEQDLFCLEDQASLDVNIHIYINTENDAIRAPVLEDSIFKCF